MKDHNKWNLKRLAVLFATLLVVVLAVVAAKVSLKFWWASLPTSGIAIATAVAIFKRGFVDPDLNKKPDPGDRQ